MNLPGNKAPELFVKTTESDQIWDLHKKKPEKFSLVVFYRGLHCPICKKYLENLNENIENFKKQGVTEIIAISGDTKEKALQAKKDWNISNVTLGYEHPLNSMTDWGLYISESIKNSEPKYFGEPGLFLIDKESKLFYCNISSMPFARPKFSEFIEGLEFINNDNYPRRGTVSYDKVKTLNGNNKNVKDEVEWRSEMEMADNRPIRNPSKEVPTPRLKKEDHLH